MTGCLSDGVCAAPGVGARTAERVSASAATNIPIAPHPPLLVIRLPDATAWPGPPSGSPPPESRRRERRARWRRGRAHERYSSGETGRGERKEGVKGKRVSVGVVRGVRSNMKKKKRTIN